MQVKDRRWYYTPPNVNIKTTPGFINISLEDFFIEKTASHVTSTACNQFTQAAKQGYYLVVSGPITLSSTEELLIGVN